MNRRDHRAAPEELPANPCPGDPDALYETGLQHMQAGRYLDAQVCCERVLAIDGLHADTMHLMGLLSHRAGQYDLAVEWMSRAIRANPKPQYLGNLGTMLLRQERYDDALKIFDKAIQLKPDDAELWKNLGNTLLKLDRSDDALLAFQHVLTLDPDHRDAAFRSGHLLYGRTRFEEALKCFELCERLQPDHPPTLQMRAASLLGLDRPEEALAVSRQAHALDPGNAETRKLMGEILRRLPGRQQEALQWFDAALEIRPDWVAALEHKAGLLIELHRFEECMAVYEHLGRLDPDPMTALKNRAVLLMQLHRFDECTAVHEQLARLDPDNPMMTFYVSQLHLLTGNFEAGWAEREARWKIPGLPIAYLKFPQPMWLGEEDVAGKTVLIYADEGLGDTLQFVRYVPLLAERGAKVILVVQDALQPLLSGLPGVSECLPKSASELPPFDMYCPLCSLPAAFGTRLETIPSGERYLPPLDAARVQAWDQRLGAHDKLRVGLVWSGNPKHIGDLNRSIPLQMFSGLLETDAIFVSLQKDPRPGDKAVLERTDIIDLTANLTDFTETAALVSCLDLVITVDTSVAHLSGALGCPTWILLPFVPDWRWLLEREDTPWYPSMRLFRQTASRDYGEVLGRVRKELIALASATA